MRIVHLCWNFDPLMGYQEAHLARVQMGRGHSVVILTSDIHGGSGPIIRHEEQTTHLIRGLHKEGEFDVYRVRGRIIFGRPWLSGLFRVLNELRPDVIHCHAVMQYYSLVAAWYQHVTGGGLVFDSHNISSMIRRGFLHETGRMFGKIIWKLVPSSNVSFVGITPQSCNLMANSYGIPAEKIHMIPLGSDHKHYCPDELDRVQFRKILKLSDSDVLVLNTGKIQQNKRLGVLVEAVCLARKTVRGLKMIQVGGGAKADIQSLKAVISANGAEEFVALQPAVYHRDLVRFFRAADICVWPGSVTISMIDAASTGVPLIVTRSEGVDYQVSNNNAIVCRESATSEDLATAIVELCENEERRKEMGRRGRRLVENYLNWESIASEFEVLYRRPPLEHR